MTSDPLLVRYPPAEAAWVLHPPVDPWGDGYVAVMRVELHEDGLSARGEVKLSWPTQAEEPDLVAFLQGLADDWRGWNGERSWRSLDGKLVITARHDGKGHVSLGANLRGHPLSPVAWLARVLITVEAGEQMGSLAADLRSHLGALPT
ncbi:DUF6228 family protein [Micromonospora chersina]|uniref:DUF6228 family protein n=1 Tax=Micromonospora chersina TaxID=47854 RepID=UPI0037104E6B